MTHAFRSRFVTPLAVAAAVAAVGTVAAVAHADEATASDDHPGTSAAASAPAAAAPSGPGAPILARGTKLTSIGDVHAHGSAVAGSVRTVDTPTSGAHAIAASAPRRRTAAPGGTAEMLAAHRPELVACVPASADPAGVVLVKAQVGPDGRALSAEVSSFSAVPSGAASCIAAVVARTSFQNHGPRAALVPLRFAVSDILKPGDAPAPSSATEATPPASASR